MLYGSFLEVRTRLLVELPRLKARLWDGQDVDSSAQHLRPKHGGGRDSVNANSPVPGGPMDVAAHPHPEQQQVDSVSTWLRADRYRRQRAVAEAVAAGAFGAGLATAATAPSQPQQSPSWSLQSPQQASAVAPGSRALGQDKQASIPYQPVIQLTPLEQRPLMQAAAGDARQGSAYAGWGAMPAEPVAGAGNGEAEPFCSDSGLEQRWAVRGQQQQQREQQQRERGAHWDALQGGALGAAQPRSGGDGPRHAGAAPARVAPPYIGDGGGSSVSSAGAQVQPHNPSGPTTLPHASRLAEDASMAAGSRAKNALLAALQYKRAGRAAGTSSSQSRTGSGPEGRWHEEDGGEASLGSSARDPQAGEGPRAGAADGVVAVVGEVQRGDAAGAYTGRNRRTDALPEAFLVCP